MIDLNNRTIWQQSCGDNDRNYSNTCLKWDVILNGPGYAGPVPDQNSTLRADGWTSKKVTDLNRFASDIKEGDLIVLRLGTNKVYGIGVVCGDYKWMDIFRDIDGWDLQHVRRVKWLKKFTPPQKFDTYTLKQGDTTQILNSDVINNWIKNLNINEENFRRDLAELPDPNSFQEIKYEDISEFLFENGVASNSINKLLEEIDELERIAKWYKKATSPSEYETVAYLVVPLLRALGWTPQKMGIEWNKVDLALFKSLPRIDENLDIVVEAKKKDNSCLKAKSQAETYAKSRSNCKRLIVTDGLRYGIYLKNHNDFHLYSYLNLTDLRNHYPIYGCAGAQESLLAMTPEWKYES